MRKEKLFLLKKKLETYYGFSNLMKKLFKLGNLTEDEFIKIRDYFEDQISQVKYEIRLIEHEIKLLGV